MYKIINIKQVFIVCSYILITCLLSKAQNYNILSFGAKPNGLKVNTLEIQSAIDKAYDNGGGKVIIPKGEFLSGSIILKKGVELHLEKNAVLIGSINPEHYSKITRWQALIMADRAKDIAITGKGTIDGQGSELALKIDSLFYVGRIDSSNYKFPEKRPKAPLRPQIIELVSCKNIKIQGVTIKSSSCWVQSYDNCQNLIIDEVKVESDTYWNNDGIDIVDCRKVRITNCYINSSDDGICLKSLPSTTKNKRMCEDIYIANCTVRSSASAVKFGTWSYSGFRNVTIKNIKVFDTFRSAIALEIFQGGIMDSVLIDNIIAKNTGNPLFIRLGNRERHVSETSPPGKLQNITIKNMKVEVPFGRPDSDYEIRGPELPFFHNTFPSSITGIPGQSVENVKLENIEITYPGRGNKAYANMPLWRLDEVPECEDHYPEFSMFGELPAWGFYVRHVKGLTMKNIKLKIKEPDYRPAMVFDDVKGLTIQELNIKGDEKNNPIILNNVKDASIEE